VDMKHRGNELEIYISADYDGCFDIFFKEPLEWLKRKYPDVTDQRITSAQKELLDFLNLITQSARKVGLYVGSVRQSHRIDGIVSERGLCLVNFPKFCEEKSKEEKSKNDKPWIFHPLLFADVKDIKNELPSGTAFKDPTLDCEIIDDKVAILEGQLRDIEKRHPQGEVHYYFFDDLDGDYYDFEFTTADVTTINIEDGKIYVGKDGKFAFHNSTGQSCFANLLDKHKKKNLEQLIKEPHFRNLILGGLEDDQMIKKDVLRKLKKHFESEENKQKIANNIHIHLVKFDWYNFIFNNKKALCEIAHIQGSKKSLVVSVNIESKVAMPDELSDLDMPTSRMLPSDNMSLKKRFNSMIHASLNCFSFWRKCKKIAPLDDALIPEKTSSYQR